MAPDPRSADAPPGARRGRPSQTRAAEIDRTILQSAQTLFLTEGYAATSMEAVAAAAGVSKGTLYARYSGKKTLFEAIAQDRLAAWSALEPGPDQAAIVGLEARTLHRANALLDSISRPEVQAFERLLAAEAARFPELAKEFYDRGYRGLVASVRADLIDALGRGAEAEADAAAAAAVFIGALIGWFRTEATIRQVSKAERREHAARVVSICLRALRLA